MKPYLKIIKADGSERLSQFRIFKDNDPDLMRDDILGLQIRDAGDGCWLQLTGGYPQGLTVHAQSLPQIWGVEITSMAELTNELRRCKRKLEFHFQWGDFITDEANREFCFFCYSKEQADEIHLAGNEYSYLINRHLRRWGIARTKTRTETRTSIPSDPVEQSPQEYDDPIEAEMQDFLRDRETLKAEYLRDEADKLFRQCGLHQFKLEDCLGIIYCGLAVKDDHNFQLMTPPMNIPYPKATDEHIDEIFNMILEELPSVPMLEYFIDEEYFMDDNNVVDTSAIEAVLYSLVSTGKQDDKNPDLFRFDSVDARNKALRKFSTALLALTIYNLSLIAEKIEQAVEEVREDDDSDNFNEGEVYWMLWQNNYEHEIVMFQWMK
ncbi:MAG: hypothetical protein H6974_14225 [Gammaproteobacteria bacterium]|nr:hypothetical protein [Gammaproteobacteria bacterium]